MAQGEELRGISSQRLPLTSPIPILSFFCGFTFFVYGNDAVNTFLGGLSAADWSVRRIGSGGSMPTTDGTIIAAAVPDIPSSGNTRSSSMIKVLENRDLCRIVASFILNLL